MAKLTCVCLVLATSLGAAGCARVSAKSTPATPPLDVPAPPPRVVETAETDAPSPGTLVDAPAGGSPSSRPRTQARPEPPKVEPPKPEPAPVPEVPPSAPELARPAPQTLQTTPPEREAELERGIRDLLQRAWANLNRVDYRRLNADGKAQYDLAKRFATQAEDALKARNHVFAQSLADRAAKIAVQLAGG